MKSAVVLLSGGVDSATTMAMARSEGYCVYALSFRYGQRHAVELEAAKNVALRLGAEKHLVIDFNLREIGGSALTSSLEVPKDTMQNPAAPPGDSSVINQKSEIPVTYVPARNTIFLSFALGWAEVLKATDIYIGANSVDYSGYPDCRPEYLKAFEEMANLATKAAVEGELRFRINAPLLRMTKADIVQAGISLGLDYGMTWSCYDPQPARDSSHISRYGYSPCGRCDSCIFRAKGFAEAGIEDPALS